MTDISGLLFNICSLVLITVNFKIVIKKYQVVWDMSGQGFKMYEILSQRMVWSINHTNTPYIRFKFFAKSFVDLRDGARSNDTNTVPVW